MENKTLHVTFKFLVYEGVSSTAWKITTAGSSLMLQSLWLLETTFPSFLPATPLRTKYHHTHECGKACDSLPPTEERNSFDNFPLPPVLIMRSLKFSTNIHDSSLPLRRGKETDGDPSWVKALNNSKEITGSHHHCFILGSPVYTTIFSYIFCWI